MEKNISISYSIMAHPSRSHFVPHLQKILDAPVSWDRGLGIWDTCKRAWNLHDHNSDYHFVIQDDAILCKDFKNRVSNFVSKFKEDSAYQLYFAEATKGKSSKKDELKKGLKRGYIVRERMPHGISIGLPTKFINSMISYCNEFDIPQDDVRIKKFLMSINIKTICPIPSLVDHRHLKSLVGGKDGRVAHYFIDKL